MSTTTVSTRNSPGAAADTVTRQVAVLDLVRDQLAAIAPKVDDPQISGLLGYLAALIDRTGDDLGKPQRGARSADRLADICGPTGASAALTRLIGDEAAGDRTAGSRIREILDQLAFIDNGVGPDSATMAHASSEEPLSVKTVARYLARRLNRPDIEVESVSLDGSGFYMRTLFVAFRAGGEREDVVLRQIPEGLDPAELAREYDVLRRVWSPDMPIPEPLWFEDDPGELGSPFIISRRVAGATLGTFAGATEPVDDEVCDQLAGLLAWLHSLDVTDLEHAPVPPMRTRDEIESAFAHFEDIAIAAAGPMSPRLAAVFAWLRAHIPPSPARTCLIHGDVGFHNMLIENGRITALLDWQRAHFGDPAEELAYIKPAVARLIGWDHFIDAYVAAGGSAPEDEALRFYTVWQDAWRAVETLPRAVLFDHEPSLMTALAGVVMGPQFLDSALATAFAAQTP